MSPFGGSQHRAAAQGPYGPDNPPPPPPGRPDNKQNQQDSGVFSPPEKNSLPTKGPGRAYLHRKLNSRQRKKRKEDLAASLEAQDRHRSRSPTRGSQGSGTFRQREPSPARQPDGWERASRSSNRQSLQDARQFTPDQVMDETYGRLSSTVEVGIAHQRPTTQIGHRSARRMDWPDDPSNLPQHEDLEDAKPHLRTGKLHGQNDQYSQYDQGPPPVPRHIPPEPDWTADRRPSSPSPLSGAHPNQNLDIEDEVAWDDESAPHMPGPMHASRMSNMNYQQPHQAAYTSHMQYPDTRGAVRPISLSRQREWKRRPWAENDHNAHRPDFQEQRGAIAEQYLPHAQFDKPRKDDRDMRSFDRRQGFAAKDRQNAPKDSFPDDDFNYLEALKRTNPPESMYDLRRYDAQVTEMHKKLPRHQSYRNGNGKAAPHVYGAMKGLDLGLCFVTFCTTGWCEMGVKCAWRHHPLTKAEREWILTNGRERGKGFLESLPKRWASPEIPVPGASMHDK